MPPAMLQRFRSSALKPKDEIMGTQWLKFRRKSYLFSFLLFICIVYGINLYISYCNSFWNPRHVNYFLESSELDGVELIVNTTGCRILDVSVWDKSLESFFIPSSPPENCRKTHKSWTFTSGQVVVINESALHEDGFSIKSVYCCYQTISRVEQSIDEYNKFADATVSVSDTCTQLNYPKTEIKAEFVRVRCSGKYWPYFQDILYRNRHVIAQPNRTQETAHKVQYWRTVGNKRPPNVLIFGVDSMSRRNFHRTMKETKEVLENIGAVEMMGYTKVGENTFPNVVPLLSGYSEEDIGEICYFTSYTAQDSCPYIWKRFSRANYLTGHLEDSPGLQMFNRYKTGFVRQQVDFYLRPFMLDAFGMIHAKDCIGPDTQDEKVFQHVASIANLGNESGTPYFIFSWLTNLAHRDMNGGYYADKSYSRFLRELDLNRTILFFMSDHGFRYGAFRETLTGWYEDKLPNLWIYLPPSVRSEHPKWTEALHHNSRRLLSPYDLYHTFNHILDQYSDTFKDDDAEYKANGSIKGLLRRQYGQSVLRKVSSVRTCAAAGVKPHFCACAIPTKLSLSSQELKLAALAAVVLINRLLPSVCQSLSFKEVTGGALLEDDPNSNHRSYAVTFLAQPGDFLFEATVVHNLKSNGFNATGDILRMNKMTNDVSCLQDAVYERFCYCKS